MKHKRREIFVYDGRACIGRFVFDEKTGDAKAFNGDRKTLGKCLGFKAAARAISEAHMAAKGRGTGGASGANALTNRARGQGLPAEALRGAPSQ